MATKKTALAPDRRFRRLHPRRDKLADATYPKPPPRPLTIYTCFIRYYLRQYNRSMRGLNDGTTVMEKLREEYRNMSPEDKVYFKEEARQEKANYQENLRIWKQHFYDQGRKEIPRIRRRSKADPTLPRRPMNEYIRFFKDNIAYYRRCNPNMQYKRLVKEMGQIWYSMTDDEKQPYRDKASADLENHETRIAEIMLQRRQNKKLRTLAVRKAKLQKLQKLCSKKFCTADELEEKSVEEQLFDDQEEQANIRKKDSHHICC